MSAHNAFVKQGNEADQNEAEHDAADSRADRLQRQQMLTPSTSSTEDEEEPPILCARCYSLRHYG